MTALEMRLGDTRNLLVTLLDPLEALDGAWTWDGTETVLSDDTSGVAVDDYIKMPETKEQKKVGYLNPIFLVTAVAANVSVTISNPNCLDIPSGTGAKGASPLDLRPPPDSLSAIIRFSLRRRPEDPRSESIALKHSYDPVDEIDINDAANGKATIYLRVYDTYSERAGTYFWDVELTRRGTLATDVGTVAFTAGDETVVGTGLDFAKLRVGDVFLPAGAVSASQKEVLITAVDEAAGTFETGGYSGWPTESGVSHEIFRGDRKTPDHLFGPFELLPTATP
jgi:hypothetical protein